MKENPLAGRDLIGIDDLDKEEMLFLLDLAEEFRRQIAQARQLDLLNSYLLATVFYEPSTRTRLSFESAMHRLGGGVISVADAKATSSAAKGETIADAARTVAGYADIMVQRHPAVGSAGEAAQAVGIPVINAGDGAGEHPTQALLDLYTIRHEKGRLDGLTVALVGDLKHGRTVHSLARALRLWDVKLLLVAPAALGMPPDLVTRLQASGLQTQELQTLGEAVEQADVLYLTRIQRERFTDAQEYERLRGAYVLDSELLARGSADLTVMHPLPRVDEIAPEVDRLPNAAYFRQAANGVWVRMALLASLLDQLA